MGTPDFAVAPLDALLKNGYDVAAVITVPDKPAGRGMQLQESAVKKYATEHGIKVLQPEKLRDENFLNEYKALNHDINIVVAFRMLPEVIWKFPPHGTFNLHASLLPNYRGAAPINWAIINGEKETGVTTFFIDDKIDTGNIILNEKIAISDDMNAGELHDKMMVIGSNLVLKTLNLIENNEVSLVNQQQLIENENLKIKEAPKIFKETCILNFGDSLASIHNRIRGLSPYPLAIAIIIDKYNQETPIKISKSRIEYLETTENIGTIKTDSKENIIIVHPEGYLYIEEIQLPGKKKLPTVAFLRGYRLLTGDWKLKLS